MQQTGIRGGDRSERPARARRPSPSVADLSNSLRSRSHCGAACTRSPDLLRYLGWDPADPTTTLQTYGAHQGTVVSLVDLGDGVLASTASNEVHLWSPYLGGS